MTLMTDPLRSNERTAERSAGKLLPSGGPAYPGLPLPTLPDGSNEGASRYTVTTVDDDGRLADRSSLAFLGWTARQPVDLVIEPGPIVVARRTGRITINTRGFLCIPLSLRRRCGLRPRDRVLIAAYQWPQELLVIPMTTTDELVHGYRRCRPAKVNQ